MTTEAWGARGRRRAGRFLLLGLGVVSAGLAAPHRALAGPEPDSEVIVLDESPAPRPKPDAAVRPAPHGAAERPRASENSELRIQALWFSRKAFIEANEMERAAEQLRAMQELRKQEGISNLETIAGAFSYEGFRQLNAGQYGAAHASFRLAKEFDPDFPHAYYGQARSLHGLRMGWIPALREAWEGMQVALRNFWSAYLLLGNLALIGLLAAAVSGAIFLLALILKYQPLLRHDLSEWLMRRRVPESAAAVGAWVLFLLPLLAGLGWMWVLLLWTLLVFAYSSRTERLLVTAVLLVAVAGLPAFHLVENTFRTGVNPEVRTLVSALRGGYDPERVRYLKEAAARDPKNANLHFLLGSLYKSGGYVNDALLHYKQAVTANPRLHQAVNNLGNLYFITQNFALAQQQYQQAVDLKPDFTIAFYNLHLAQYQQFHVEDAEQSLETARRLDPEGIGQLRTSDLPPSVIDARLELDQVWPGVSAVPGKLGAAVNGSAPWPSPYAMAAGGTIVASYVLTARRRQRARSCIKCGRPFCSRCRSGRENPDYCTQCVHLFVKRDGLAPATKKAKLGEVQSFESRRRLVGRALSALAPGFGHVWGDRPLVGMAALALSSFCLLVVALHERLLRFYEVAYADDRSVAGLVAAGAALLIWLGMNLITPVRRS